MSALPGEAAADPARAVLWRFLLIAAACLAGLAVVAIAAPREKAEGGKDGEVIATINGEPVTKAEWAEIWKADQWFAPDLKTRPGYEDRMAGRPYEDFFFREEIVKIRGMRQKYAEALPQMKATIDEALQKARAGGDFSEIAKQYSQDQASAVKGGSLGNKEFHELVFPFNRVAFKMSEGQISDPVLTVFGFHIIRLDSVLPATEGKGKQVNLRHVLIRFPAADAKTESEFLADQAKVEVLDRKLCKKLVSYCTDAS